MKAFAITLCLAFVLGLFGCSKPVHDWGASDIQSWIKKEWALVDVTVTDNGDGTFAASGKTEAGTSFTFRFEKKPDVKEMHWIRITGDETIPDGGALKSY